MPPPPQVLPPAQVPQLGLPTPSLAMPPQPSPAMPQETPSMAQVLGTHGGAPHWNGTPPPPQLFPTGQAPPSGPQVMRLPQPSETWPQLAAPQPAGVHRPPVMS